MTYRGHDGYKQYIIGVSSGTFEFEGRLYACFIRSSFIFAEVHIMIEQLESRESIPQCVSYVPAIERRKLEQEKRRENNKGIKRENNKERKNENNKKEKRIKVKNVPE